MKRKMIGAAAAYMSGLFFASLFISPGGLVLLAAALIALIAGLCRRLIDSRDIIIILASFTLALGVYTKVNGRNEQIVYELSGNKCSFTGEIRDITVYSGKKASYVLRGNAGGYDINVSYYGTDFGASYGDIISIENCTLKEIQNSYLFDSVSWYRSRHIFLEINSAKGISLERRSARPLKNVLMNFRKRTIDRFCDVLGNDAGGFLSGMVFGEKGGIDDSIRKNLYRCGIGHILAVSGLHVSIIAGMLMLILRRAGAGRVLTFAAADLLLVFLIALAQYPVSALRAAIMMNLVFGSWLFRRITDRLNSLAIAALLICLCDPYAVHSSGFILSLAGTFGIGVFAPYMARNISSRGIVYNSALCFWAMIAIMPVSILYFDDTSIISPLTNVFLVPMCTAAMCLGFVAMLSFGALDILLYPAGLLINTVLVISDKLSGMDIFISGFDRNMRILGICLGAFTVLVYLFTRNRKLLIAVTTASSVVFCVSSAFRAVNIRNGFSAAVIGTDKKCAAAVICDGKAVIADLSGNYKAADYAAEYLSSNGITSLNAVVLTRNVNSQLAAYDNALSGTKTGEWIVSGETAHYGFENSITNIDNGTKVKSGDMLMTCSDGCITFSCGNRQFCFVTDNKGKVTVYCTSDDMGTEVDDIPGYTLDFTVDGRIIKRRL